MWFWLSLIALLCWSGSDLFSKIGCRDADDKLAHLKMVIAVGVVMGLHAAYEIFIGGTQVTWHVIWTYLPVSLLYISSMAMGYIGLRYIELSISSPICNSSGALVAVMTLIFVGAVGIAVRAIAPHCKSKAADPAVVVVDEGGNFAVPLLSGHLGGANALARALAKACGAVPVITTATDVNGLFAVDLWAKAQNCAVLEPERIKRVSGALLAGQTVRYWSPWPVAGEAPAGVKKTDAPEAADFALTLTPQGEALHLVPRIGVLGVGCRRGTTAQQLEEAFAAFCAASGLSPAAVCAAASIDLKKDEPGLAAFCKAHGWPITFYPADELRAVPGQFTPSAFVASVTGVDNVCERSAVKASGGTLLLPKTASGGVTLALAVRPFAPDWRTEQ